MNSYIERHACFIIYVFIISLYINYYISIFYHLSIYLASIHESKDGRNDESHTQTLLLCYTILRKLSIPSPVMFCSG